MGRAPCCEKMGVKKGPWNTEEDHILINHINFYGHGNWRALPKQAGLLRCGKSCRLRWINYLRPDIKRGNFSKEEEDTIVDLHEMLGNRWSAIAAKLPGRTDNEIKNIWHTHLKKKLKPNQDSNNNNNNKRQAKSNLDSSKSNIKNYERQPSPTAIVADMPCSPLESSSEASTETTSQNNSSNNTCTTKIETREDVSEIDENLWSGVLSADNSRMAGGDVQVDDRYLASSPLTKMESVIDDYCSNLYDVDANLDLWYDFFVRVDDLSELPEI